MDEVVMSLKNITKEYPGVIALNDVSMDFQKGEVHALLGENGAGKSTMIKIISGAVVPDKGTISIEDKSYSTMTPHLAKTCGVEVIYQEFNLVECLSVAENICLGDKLSRFVDYDIMEKKAVEIFEKFQININPKSLVRDLPTSQQQIVEIAKAVSKKAKILIMDEPSAPLSISEVDSLFRIIRAFKAEGVTIIYISHRMDEIFEISDRVTVMRDGCYIKTIATKATNRKELIELMVGRALTESYPVKNSKSSDVAIELINVTGNGDENISFAVNKGEILGIAGLVGAGRTELARVVYGLEKLDSGSIKLSDKETKIKSPKDAIKKGIGLIPEDRKGQGCFLDNSIEWNITIASIKGISKGFVVNKKKEVEISNKYSSLLNIKTPSLQQKVKNLSGGNQQKVVLAKTLATNSNVIIFDEPTRGIDVGAKQEIYKLMCGLAEEGKALIMITSDMEELLGMSDRIVVLAEGKQVGIIEKGEFSQNLILELASGCH